MRRCRQTGREYLLCDYNRDGDSYRSPWSNEFDPPLAGGGGGGGGSATDAPTEKVRRMEVRANEAFDVYRELYYEGGVSSVYFWNLDDGFAGVVLLKKGELGCSYFPFFFLLFFLLPFCPSSSCVFCSCFCFFPLSIRVLRLYESWLGFGSLCSMNSHMGGYDCLIQIGLDRSGLILLLFSETTGLPWCVHEHEGSYRVADSMLARHPYGSQARSSRRYDQVTPDLRHHTYDQGGMRSDPQI